MSTIVPLRRTIPIAWLNAAVDTAVTSTPCIPPVCLTSCLHRIGIAAVDGQVRAEPLRQIELRLIDVERGDVEAHRLGILHGDVAEPADARNRDPFAGARFGFLEALVGRHSGAQDRRDLLEVGAGVQVADVSRPWRATYSA